MVIDPLIDCESVFAAAQFPAQLIGFFEFAPVILFD